MTYGLPTMMVNMRYWLAHAHVDPDTVKVVFQVPEYSDVERVTMALYGEAQPMELTRRLSPASPFIRYLGIEIEVAKKVPPKDCKVHTIDWQFDELTITEINRALHAATVALTNRGARVTGLKFEYVVLDPEDPQPSIRLRATGVAS